MYLPIWVSGEPAPANGYRDLFNGRDILLAKPDRLPAGPDGKVTIYVPLHRRQSVQTLDAVKGTTWQTRQ